MKKILSIFTMLIVFSLYACNVYADFFFPNITVAPDASAGSCLIGSRNEDPPQQTLTANSNNGYEFEGWYENGGCISQIATEVFDADRERNLVATFKPATYSVNTSTNPQAGGSASKAPEKSQYSYNESVTVTANPFPGYVFQNWTENGSIVSTSSSYSFTVTASRNLVANFTSTYHVTATAGAGGSASKSPDKSEYSYNEQVTVTANPLPGYVFQNWTENGTVVSTSSSYSFAVTASRNLVANFTLATYHVTVRYGVGGTATGGGDYPAGSTAWVTAIPDEPDYVFSRWEIGGAIRYSNPCPIEVNENVEAVAYFAPKPNMYTITYRPGTDCAGTAFTDSWEAGTAYLAGQSFFKNNYTQNGWSLTQGGAKAYDLEERITLTKDLTLYPYWTKNAGTLKLTVNYSGEGVVYLNGTKITSGTVYDISEGRSITFTMKPNSEDYYVYSINLAGKYWNANVDTDKFMVTYEMMKTEDRTLTIKFDSVTAPPKTGDSSNLLLWSSLFGLSAAAVTTGMVLKKKSKN